MKSRLKKNSVIRARCDVNLKLSIERIAAINQLDPSDVIRIACANYVQKFQQISLISLNGR